MVKSRKRLHIDLANLDIGGRGCGEHLLHSVVRISERCNHDGRKCAIALEEGEHSLSRRGRDETLLRAHRSGLGSDAAQHARELVEVLFVLCKLGDRLRDERDEGREDEAREVTGPVGLALIDKAQESCQEWDSCERDRSGSRCAMWCDEAARRTHD